jgi:hypothetical protein
MVLFIGVSAALGAVISFCGAAEVTDHIERLGSAVADIERAPLGARVRFEGNLVATGDPVRHPPDGRRCVASFSEVTLVTETGSGDDTDQHHYQLFRAVRGPKTLVVEGGGRKVAVPLTYWSRFDGRRRREIERWPRWLGHNYMVSDYRGSIEHYVIEELCLAAGARLFVSGAVVAVYDGANAEDISGAPMAEAIDPVVVLRPSGDPVEVWPGTEASRLKDLHRDRERQRASGFIFATISATFLGLAAWLAVRRRRRDAAE